MSIESVTESEKIFFDPNPNKNYSDPQHCELRPVHLQKEDGGYARKKQEIIGK
jgi:hypothetical protein